MKLKHALLLFIVLISACKRSEIEQIPSNEPPPDHTISSVNIENYINRTYILTLGREPSSSEFANAFTLLSSSSLDSVSLHIFLDEVFSNTDYLVHVYTENRIDLLNNVDTAEFTYWISLFDVFLADTVYQFQWPYFQYENDRMMQMRNGYSDFINGNIDVSELQARMCNNYLYDQINMGSDNFVISTFQHMINRNPTVAEQTSGVAMVDGSNSVLFLLAGSSKNDYLNIFTHSADYYEGQVVLLYQKYLHRAPTTQEMAAGTSRYMTTGDYTAVQRDILSSDEFIGH